MNTRFEATRWETILPGEPEAIQEVLRLVVDRMKAQYPEGTRPALRDAHPKHHGVVRAELAVEPGLPPEYAVGVFREARTYPAWVRFSNGSGMLQKDNIPDGRGVAVKLMGVAGEKLMEDEKDAQTQDFLFINHDVFFVRDAKDYVEFFRIVTRDTLPTKFFLGPNPFKWRLKEMNNAKNTRVQIANPLDVQYWSMVPLLMGNRPAKASVRPVKRSGDTIPESPTPDFLREVMAAQLARENVEFDFLVQLQTDPKAMPVEDPRIRWDETRSPYRKVATLRIPAQRFDTPAQHAFAENLSYTPWHCLPEHRPLGGVNRCRKSVYQAISKIRHEANDAARREPTGNETF